MHTDEIGLTHQFFSVFVRVQNLASFVKDSTMKMSSDRDKKGEASLV
jgi:hypothetical protein